MDKNLREQWERFLTPDILRTNLLIASVYLSSYEILKNTIIERIRDFFWSGWNVEDGEIIDPKYDADVLSKNKSSLYSSLQWLKEMEAISDDDMSIFNEVKNCRNQIAHGLSKMIMEGLPTDITERFSDMYNLLDKIEKWWIINVEIPTDEEFIGKEIDEGGIVPGTVAAIKMMLDIAFGTDEEAEYYIKEFIK